MENAEGLLSVEYGTAMPKRADGVKAERQLGPARNFICYFQP